MHRLLASSLRSPRWLFVSSFCRHSTRRCLQSSRLPRLVEGRFCFKLDNLSKVIPKTINRAKNPKVSSEDGNDLHILWWKERMQMLRKPSSMQLVKRLTYSNLLGLNVSLKNGSLKEGTLNMEILQFKSRFPREVLLCRVGDFYEAIGFDACILVEYAGLNPFGGLRTESIPRAGCPVVNLRQTLDDLTRAGFSICVVEEVQGPAHARCRKSRFVSGHAHPGSPYVFGLAEVDHDVEFPEPRPVVGISRSAKGYCMVSVLEMMKTYSAEDGLTEEAVIAKLRICQYHHLFLHKSLRDNSSGTSRWGEFGEGGLLWGECHEKPFEWFDGIPIEELLCKVREIYGLDEAVAFRSVTFTSYKRPQPLFFGTATQIGVIPTEGIPSLLKVLLPTNTLGLPMLFIRDLLLNPPPYEIASAIQETCRLISRVTSSIPDFTCISAAKIVKLLESKEANHIELCRIKCVADEILSMHGNNELSAILPTLLEPAKAATGLRVEYDMMVNDCFWISRKISEIISQDDEKGQEISYFEFIPEDFFEDMESSWKGRVKRVHVEEAFAEVDRAAESLSIAVKEDFVPIVERVKSVMSSFGGPRGEICYSKEHEALWFKGKRFIPSVWGNTPGEEQIKQLKSATDSKGRKVGEEWYTTSNIEDTLNRYHVACDKARGRVLDVLRALSAELQVKINVLIFSSMLLIIAKALFCHVSEGMRRKWVFPTLVEFVGAKDEDSTRVSGKLDLVGLSPYWFDVAEGSAIQNDVQMKSLYLLTGPNGGGKSSLLRSICAAALLGVCGLMVPARSASIPHFDSIILHMKAYDSPADGKSSFQIEMSEMRSMINAATPRSLVLVDEICRGTETTKGACIAGSIIERFDQIGCMGIVSTHLHGIFNLPLDAQNIEYKAMGSEIVDGRIKPTWKLLDGVCRESLAFETALGEGLPFEIVARAEDLYYSTINVNNSHSSSIGVISDLGGPTSLPAGYGKPGSRNFSPGISRVLLKEVENALTSICLGKVKELQKKSSPDLIEIKCTSIGAREQPPPSTVGTSCIYILFRPDNSLYVGQTDNITGRVRTHRSKKGLQDATFLYMVVPGKSIACQLETLLINQLPFHGFRLINKADGKHRNFGTSSLALEGLSLHQ